jgi:hypothetical protein
MNTRTIITEDRRPELEKLIRSLPAVLSGRVRDVHGIAFGLKSRIGWTFFALVSLAFEEKARGGVDSAGESWHPLSKHYLAYQRRLGSSGGKKPRGPGKAPGGNNGFLSNAELKLWNRIYADRYAWFMMREPDKDASSHAAAVAWTILKAMGAKTKLEEFGNRVAGADYQILTNNGTMRRTLMPGELVGEGRADSEYHPPRNQEFDDQGNRLVVGSNDPKAKYHHHAKDPKRRRRLWPERLPADWWRQITDQAAAGLGRIGELYGGTPA